MNTLPEHEPLRTGTVTSGSTRQRGSDVAEDDDDEVEEGVAVVVRDIVAVRVEVLVADLVGVTVEVDDPEPVLLPVLVVVAVAVPEEEALSVAEPVAVPVPVAVSVDVALEVAEFDEEAVAELDWVAVAEVLEEDDAVEDAVCDDVAVDVADPVFVTDAELVAEAEAEDDDDTDAVNELDVESERRDAPQSAGHRGTIPPHGQTRGPLKYVPAHLPLVEMYMPWLTSTGSLEWRGVRETGHASRCHAPGLPSRTSSDCPRKAACCYSRSPDCRSPAGSRQTTSRGVGRPPARTRPGRW